MESGELEANAAADRRSPRQFSYDDADDMVFMNMESYEEERIPRANIDMHGRLHRAGDGRGHPAVAGQAHRRKDR